MHDRLRASTVLEAYERRFEILGIVPAKLGNEALHGSGPLDAMTLFTGSCFFFARTSGIMLADDSEFTKEQWTRKSGHGSKWRTDLWGKGITRRPHAPPGKTKLDSENLST